MVALKIAVCGLSTGTRRHCLAAQNGFNFVSAIKFAERRRFFMARFGVTYRSSGRNVNGMSTQSSLVDIEDSTGISRTLTVCPGIRGHMVVKGCVESCISMSSFNLYFRAEIRQHNAKLCVSLSTHIIPICPSQPKSHFSSPHVLARIAIADNILETMASEPVPVPLLAVFFHCIRSTKIVPRPKKLNPGRRTRNRTTMHVSARAPLVSPFRDVQQKGDESRGSHIQ